MLRPPVEDELTSTAIRSEVLALPDAALEGDKEALGPPGPSRPFMSALVIALSCQPGSVIVEELLKLVAGHLAANHPLADLDDLVFVARNLSTLLRCRAGLFTESSAVSTRVG